MAPKDGRPERPKEQTQPFEARPYARRPGEKCGPAQVTISYPLAI